MIGAGSAGGVIPNLREDPVPTPAPGVFSFRGGVQWNMTRELVKALETVELTDRPFYVGVQYHPEFKSRPNKPHPLFLGFIGAALKRQGEKDI